MILIIDDDIAIRASLKLLLQQAGYKTTEVEGPKPALAFLKSQQPKLILLDMNFSVETTGEEGMALLKEIKLIWPQVPVILITGWGSIDLAVEGMKAGAVDFITKPWNNQRLLQAVETALQLAELHLTNNPSASRKSLDNGFDFGNIIGANPQLVSILKTISRVCKTDASVLITGESGTGKELIAEAIHHNSHRAEKPFIKVNLGGISSTLFESEMFGHKRGAFTDAHSDRVGRFELANTGTIFLDEIGDLDAGSQVKLLRVLQDRTYEVLGDSQTRQLDVRVVCATNRDLTAMVEKQTFREDLFYRINLIIIRLPALRERPDDIPLLVRHFIQNLQQIYQRPQLDISRKALKWLSGLPFPGNIRELKNLVERAALVSDRDILEVEDFERHRQANPNKQAKGALPAVGSMTLEELEKIMIQKAMQFHHANISQVAKSLGLSRAALYRRLDKYKIPYESPH